MTVGELREQLIGVHESTLVVQSKDSEGNSFSPTAEIGHSMYRAESSYYGDIGLKRLTPDLEKQGFTEEDVMKDGVSAIVLWPTN